ncbi:MAG: DUF4355 domain-containing protein [Clostridia bacterium]|nr:DUF4355 domain-containing protein [Clostridia bacterium]
MADWKFGRLGNISRVFLAQDDKTSAGAGMEGATGAAGGTEDDNGSGGGAQPTFDELIKNPAYQSEFDRRVTKALETAKTKWQAETAAQISEAEKLAKMTAEQKAQHEREKKDKELAQREAALTLKELRATAGEALSAKGIPLALLDALDFGSAEKCTASIDKVEAAFRASVQSAVEQRLKGGTPPAGGGTVDYDKMTDSEYYKAIQKK